MYSEDLINTSLVTLKDQLPLSVYPALNAEESDFAAPLQRAEIRYTVDKLLETTSFIFGKLAKLVRDEEVPEATVINSVYCAVAPFFVQQSVKGKGKAVSSSAVTLKALQNQAITLLRQVRAASLRGKEKDSLQCAVMTLTQRGSQVFARHPQQRHWIIEEALTSISKLPDVAKRRPQYVYVPRYTIRRPPRRTFSSFADAALPIIQRFPAACRTVRRFMLNRLCCCISFRAAVLARDRTYSRQLEQLARTGFISLRSVHSLTTLSHTSPDVQFVDFPGYARHSRPERVVRQQMRERHRLVLASTIRQSAQKLDSE